MQLVIIYTGKPHITTLALAVAHTSNMPDADHWKFSRSHRNDSRDDFLCIYVSVCVKTVRTAEEITSSYA